jgi:hypothetical protein
VSGRWSGFRGPETGEEAIEYSLQPAERCRAALLLGKVIDRFSGLLGAAITHLEPGAVFGDPKV